MVGEHVATCGIYSWMDFDNDEYLDFVLRVNVPWSYNFLVIKVP
jgi:hypothetical protein